MISINYKTEAVKENPHKLDVRQLYSEEAAQIMHITLKPGESLKPHKTPVNAVFYILDGVAIIHIGDESKSFEKDTLVESPAEITHYISNNGAQSARILVIKAPRQTNATRLL